MNSTSFTPHRDSPLRLAFKLSLPVFLSYFPLGLVFGALFTKLHEPWFFASLMSIFAYSGAVQFVTLGLLKEQASYVFIFLSIILIAGRNMFYGLSLLKRYRMPWFKKIVSIFLLVDTNYAVMLKTPMYEDKKQDNLFCVWLAVFIYLYWVVGTLLGSLIGNQIPGVENLEFVLVAFFAITLLEQYRKTRAIFPIFIGLISFLLALCLVPETALLLFAISLSAVALVRVFYWRERSKS